MKRGKLWLGLCLIVGGCDLLGSVTTELSDTRWVLSTMLVGESVFEPDTLAPYVWEIQFIADGFFGGFAGCNGIGGTYTAKTNGRIEISVDNMTQKLCREIDALEQAMLRMLGEVKRFDSDGEVLRLYGSSRSVPRFVFTRKVQS